MASRDFNRPKLFAAMDASTRTDSGIEVLSNFYNLPEMFVIR